MSLLLAPTAVVAAFFFGAALLVGPLLPAAYRAEPEALLAMVTALLWVGVVAAPAVTFVKALVLGTVAWATLVILGAEARFRAVVRTILLGECILAAQGLFIAVILRARGAEVLRTPEDLRVATGLDAFIDGAGPVLAALARGVTPFHAAWLVFLTLALAQGAHTSRTQGGAAALGVWSLVAGVGVLRALVAETTAVIRLRDFGVRHPGFELGPITVHVARGERVALVGANGAGKSTTLRALGGLLPEYRGVAQIEGVEVRDAGPQVRARVGVLPERLMGFGWMSVSEHLAFLEAFYPTWDAPYARDLRERLALPTSTKLAQLSRGMQVKLSLVSAEGFRPPLLLLDEPTSGIDPIMRGEIIELIDSLAPPGSGRTVVCSSHILEDLERIAGRVLLIKEGRLVEDVSISRLIEDGGGASPAETIYRMLADE